MLRVYFHFFAKPNSMGLPPQRLRNLGSGVTQRQVNGTKELLVSERHGEVANRPSVRRGHRGAKNGREELRIEWR